MAEDRTEDDAEDVAAHPGHVDDGLPAPDRSSANAEDEDARSDDDDDDDDDLAEASGARLVVGLEGAWSGTMPDAAALKVAESAAHVEHRRPSERIRGVVMAQLLLVATGAVAWWGLLHLGLNVAMLELGWFFAAAIGVILLGTGHLRRLTWLTVFGGVTSAGPLLFQMRGADLLLGYGLTVFNALLAVMLVGSLLLAVLAVREIDAVA